MAETIKEANILDPRQYAQKEQGAVMKMEAAFGVDNGGLPRDFLVLRLQHLCNGGFVLFQAPL